MPSKFWIGVGMRSFGALRWTTVSRVLLPGCRAG
jgi:hypothetical protein